MSSFRRIVQKEKKLNKTVGKESPQFEYGAGLRMLEIIVALPKYVTPLSCMVKGRNTIGNLSMQHVAATNHFMSTGRGTSPCKIRCGGTS